MKYIYECKKCGNVIQVIRSAEKRHDVPDCKCGSAEWQRRWSAPFNSKLIGALRASERDGVGVLIDSGKINMPISRGSKDTRKKTWQKDRESQLSPKNE